VSTRNLFAGQNTTWWLLLPKRRNLSQISSHFIFFHQLTKTFPTRTNAKMIGACNWRFTKLAATRPSTTWQAVLRPVLASHSIPTVATNNFVRYHSTVPVNKYSGTGFVERPLKILDFTAVEQIKKELAEVDVNSDERYVNPI
jgi:hypothetical protein